MKPVRARVLARRDVEEAYAAEAGREIALRFVEALADTYRLIAVRPVGGSPRFGIELDLPGLRHQKLRRFPYMVFYVEHADHIDVWRVLHVRRDIPAWMGGEE